jgi:DNA-binding transcriptional MerR regulator
MNPAAAGDTPAPGLLSIGEVLAELRTEFPDVTISKIRFLEAEGLVEPARSRSGYRKFSRADVARLRFVLLSQRDHYLPLRVIKDQLAQSGSSDEDRGAASAGRPPRALVSVEPGHFAPPADDVRLSAGELAQAAGISEEQVADCVQHGLVSMRPGTTWFDADALAVAVVVKEMARYGLEARHLRAFRTAADREVGLVQQVVTPLARQRHPEARARAQETAREMAALSVRLHAALVRAGLGPDLAG